MKDQNNDSQLSKQLVANIGLFYTCYELSKMGWNCLPTSRNAKGVDIVIYSQNSRLKYAIQVKSLSKRNPVPFGTSAELIADFLIIYREAKKEETKPEIFVLSSKDIGPEVLGKSESNGKVSFWLSPRSYETHKDRWDKIQK